jgi:hypothetical protein
MELLTEKEKPKLEFWNFKLKLKNNRFDFLIETQKGNKI